MSSNNQRGIYFFYQFLDDTLGLNNFKNRLRFFYILTEPDHTALTHTQILEIEEIIQAKHCAFSSCIYHGDYFEVSNRTEMVSPWCSNVLTVLHRLGFTMVERIETSMLYPKKYYYFENNGETAKTAKTAKTEAEAETAKTEAETTEAETETAEAEAEAEVEGKVRIDFDPMTQQICNRAGKALTCQSLSPGTKREGTYIINPQDEADFRLANRTLDLGMDEQDISMYLQIFANREYLTDAELLDLAQSNSEHSRHWVFNGLLWHRENKTFINKSLFDIIKKPIRDYPRNSLVAMNDNSSAIRGYAIPHYRYDFKTRSLQVIPTKPGIGAHWLHPILTAETHNFPTGIAPRPGSATGVGGRIRDIQAMGRGGQMIAGIAGYAVGRIDHSEQGFEYPLHRPEKILIEASNGASDYGNKIGEPMIQGFCRSFGKKLRRMNNQHIRSEYVKPIMFSAGVGQVFAEHLYKQKGELGYLIVRLGGPAFRIGVGGGSASSRSQGINDKLATAVQRDNPEMENRLQKVIRTCVELGNRNPIISIHDQGAGGMGNVTKEIIMDASTNSWDNQTRLGAIISLGNVVSGDPTLSARELWTAEYQEQNTILIHPRDSSLIKEICQREGCPVAFVGVLTEGGKCEVYDPSVKLDMKNAWVAANPVNFELSSVLGKMPPKRFNISDQFHQNSAVKPLLKIDLSTETLISEDINEALQTVLGHLSVGSKRFLTNKVDRSVSGLVVQQQCVGPYHTPLSDYALVAQSLLGKTGIATAVGEQPVKGLLDPQLMVEQTVGEMLTNLIWVKMSHFDDIKCSGNWMWEKSDEEECYALYLAVTRASELLSQLGIAIDGGKDSLSMSARINEHEAKVISPRTLVMTAYVTVPDINRRVTPEFKEPGNHLIYVDFGCQQYRMGGAVLIQEYTKHSLGDECPRIDSVSDFKKVLMSVQDLLSQNLIKSGHDRSDGGLITCLIEMALASPYGLKVDLSGLKDGDLYSLLFAEELGLVMEVREDDVPQVMRSLMGCTEGRVPIYDFGMVSETPELELHYDHDFCYTEKISTLRSYWEKPSYQMELKQCFQKCAQAEYQMLCQENIPVPQHRLGNQLIQHDIIEGARPKVAILRDMGSNGDREMAHAFHLAGFEPVDVTMTDLMSGRYLLGSGDFRGLAFVGGFTFADALGAGRAWALSIQHNTQLWQDFQNFKARADTFSLGVCNGCQLMSELGWVKGRFTTNESQRFESRFSNVRVNSNQSIMLQGMQESVLGIWVAHGEGRYIPEKEGDDVSGVISYVDASGSETMNYPDNPNGSQGAVAGVCSDDGRHLAMMPHPERCVMRWQVPWLAPELRQNSTLTLENSYPWIQMFRNAYNWCQSK